MTTGEAPVRCVLGMRRFGKTTLARTLVADARYLLVYDPQREYDVLHLEWRALEEYLDAAALEDFRRGFRVGLIEPGREEDVCALAWVIGLRLEPRRLVVLLEEADLVARPGRETPAFLQLVAQGRHHEIELIACSRRPAEVSRFLTANASELYCFRTQEPKDIVYLRGIIGLEPAERLPAFDVGDYIAWEPPMSWRQAKTAPDGTASRTGAETARKFDSEDDPAVAR